MIGCDALERSATTERRGVGPLRSDRSGSVPGRSPETLRVRRPAPGDGRASPRGASSGGPPPPRVQRPTARRPRPAGRGREAAEPRQSGRAERAGSLAKPARAHRGGRAPGWSMGRPNHLLAQGERAPTRIQPPPPTTRGAPGLARRSSSSPRTSSPGPVAARSQSCPRTSPAGSPLIQQNVNDTHPGTQPRRRLPQQIHRRHLGADMYQATALQSAQTSRRVRMRCYRFQASDRDTAVQYQDRVPGPHLVDERAQAILGFGDRCCPHSAILARCTWLVKLHPPPGPPLGRHSGDHACYAPAAVPILFDPLVLMAALLVSAALLLLAWSLGVSGVRAVRAGHRRVVQLRAAIDAAERDLPARATAARAQLGDSNARLARRSGP